MARIQAYSVAVTTTGAAGSAAGNNTVSNVPDGEIVALNVNFHASTPATADTTISLTGTGSQDKTILTVSNSTTDAWFHPTDIPSDASGVAIAGASERAAMFGGKLKVAVAQGDALTNAVVVTAYVKVA